MAWSMVSGAGLATGLGLLGSGVPVLPACRARRVHRRMFVDFAWDVACQGVAARVCFCGRCECFVLSPWDEVSADNYCTVW